MFFISDHDITGLRFGHLTVIGRDYSYKSNKHTKWICKCDCGNEKSIFRNSLIGGSSKSCGCQMNKGTKGINATHGMSKTRIYAIWMSMRKRCNNPTEKDKKSYFDRGITVCEEWQNSFENFYDWAMKNGYNESLTIDRIDNDLGYCPENCRWITIAEQQSNKTNSVRIMYNGKEYCLRSLCTEIGFPYKLAHRRYKRMNDRNEPIDLDKIFKPVRRRNQESNSLN